MRPLALRGVAVKKLVLAIMMVGVMAAPVWAQPQPRECVKLTNQITRYQRDAGWARDRANLMWEKASLDQVERLATRRAKKCPEYREQESMIAELAALAMELGELAARYYLLGL